MRGPHISNKKPDELPTSPETIKTHHLSSESPKEGSFEKKNRKKQSKKTARSDRQNHLNDFK